MWFDMNACPCLPIYSELYFMAWKQASDAVHPELMPKAPPIRQSVPLTSFLQWRAGRNVTVPAKNIHLVSSVPSVYLAVPDWCTLSPARSASSHVMGVREEEELAAVRAWEARQCFSFSVESVKRKTKCLILQHPKSKRCLQWRVLLPHLTQGTYFKRLTKIKVFFGFLNFYWAFFEIKINRESKPLFSTPKHHIIIQSERKR